MDVYVSVQFVDPAMLRDAGAASDEQGLWVVLKPHLLLTKDKAGLTSLIEYFSKPADDKDARNYILIDDSHRELFQEYCAGPPKKDPKNPPQKAEDEPEKMVLPVCFPPCTCVYWRLPFAETLLRLGDANEQPPAGSGGWATIALANGLDQFKGADGPAADACRESALTTFDLEECGRLLDWLRDFKAWWERGTTRIGDGSQQDPAALEEVRRAMLGAFAHEGRVLQRNLAEAAGTPGLLAVDLDGIVGQVKIEGKDDFVREKFKSEVWETTPGLRQIYYAFVNDELRGKAAAAIDRLSDYATRPGNEKEALYERLCDWPQHPLFKYDYSDTTSPCWNREKPVGHDTYLDMVWAGWKKKIETSAFSTGRWWQVASELQWFMSAGERLFWPNPAEPADACGVRRGLFEIDRSLPPRHFDGEKKEASAHWTWTSSYFLLGLMQPLLAGNGWPGLIKAVADAGVRGRPSVFDDLGVLTIGPSGNLLGASAGKMLSLLLETLARECHRAQRRRPGDMQRATFAEPVATPGLVIWRTPFQTLNPVAEAVKPGTTLHEVSNAFLDLLESQPSCYCADPAQAASDAAYLQLTPQRLAVRASTSPDQSDIFIDKPTLDRWTPALSFDVRVRRLLPEPIDGQRLLETFSPSTEFHLYELVASATAGDGSAYAGADIQAVAQALRDIDDMGMGADIGYLRYGSSQGYAVLRRADVAIVDGPTPTLWWFVAKQPPYERLFGQTGEGARIEIDGTTTRLVLTRPSGAPTSFNAVLVPPSLEGVGSDGVVLAPSKFFDFSFTRSVDAQAFSVDVTLEQPLLQDKAAWIAWRQWRSAQKCWLWLESPTDSLRLTEDAHLRPIASAAPEACEEETGPKVPWVRSRYVYFARLQPSAGVDDALADEPDKGVVNSPAFRAEERRYALWCRAGHQPFKLVVGLDQQYGFRNFSTVADGIVFKATSLISHPADVRWTPEEDSRQRIEKWWKALFDPVTHQPPKQPIRQLMQQRSDLTCLQRLAAEADCPLLSWRFDAVSPARAKVTLMLDRFALLCAFHEPFAHKPGLDRLKLAEARRIYEVFHELFAGDGEAWATTTVHFEQWRYDAASPAGDVRRSVERPASADAACTATSNAPDDGAAPSRTIGARLVRKAAAAAPLAVDSSVATEYRALAQTKSQANFQSFADALVTVAQATVARLAQRCDEGRFENERWCNLGAAQFDLEMQAGEACDVLRAGVSVERAKARVFQDDEIPDLAAAGSRATLRRMKRLLEKDHKAFGTPTWLKLDGTQAKDEKPLQTPFDSPTDPRIDPVDAARLAGRRAACYLGRNDAESEVRRAFRWLPRYRREPVLADPPGAAPGEPEGWQQERAAQVVGTAAPISLLRRAGNGAAPVQAPDAGSARAWFYTVPVAFAPLPAHAELKDQRSTQEFFVFLLRLLNDMANGSGAMLRQVVDVPKAVATATGGSADDAAKSDAQRNERVKTLAQSMAQARRLRADVAGVLVDHYLTMVEDDEEDGGELKHWKGRFSAEWVTQCGIESPRPAACRPLAGEEDVERDRALIQTVRTLREAALGSRNDQPRAAAPQRSVVREHLRRALAADLSGYLLNKGWALHLFDPDAPAAARLCNVQIRKMRTLAESGRDLAEPASVARTLLVEALALAGGPDLQDRPPLRGELYDAIHALKRAVDGGATRMTLRASIDILDDLCRQARDPRQATPAVDAKHDTDVFTTADLLTVADGDRRFVAIVDPLDDASYANEFQVHAWGTRAQSYDDLLVGVPAPPLKSAAPDEDRRVCRNGLDEMRKTAGADRSLELVPVHHNPEWRSWEATPGGWQVRRGVHLLPSRLPPDTPRWMAPAAALPEGAPRVAPLPTAGLKPGQLGRYLAMPDEMATHVFVAPAADRGGGMWKKVGQTSPTDKADGSDQLDAYLWYAHFLVDGDEETGGCSLSNDVLQLEVEDMPAGLDTLPGGTPPRDGAPFPGSPLVAWHRYFRAIAEQRDGQVPAAPAPLPPQQLVADLQQFLAKGGKYDLLQAVKPPCEDATCDKDDQPRSRETYGIDFVDPMNCSGDKVLDLRVRPQHSPGKVQLPVAVVLSAAIYQLDKDGAANGKSGRYLVRIALLGSVLRNYQLRLRLRRNARDADLDADPDINRMFRMESLSNWIRPGQMQARWKGLAAATLPVSPGAGAGAVLVDELPDAQRIAGPRYADWLAGKSFLQNRKSWKELVRSARGAPPDARYKAIEGQAAAAGASLEVRVFHYEIMSDFEDVCWAMREESHWDDTVHVGPKGALDTPETRATASLRAIGRGTWGKEHGDWAPALLDISPSQGAGRRRAVSIEWRSNQVAVLRVDGLPVVWA